MMETLPSGTILQGHYRIERALGSGGFGHVYLGVDLRTSQQYAIKEYLVTGSSGQAQLEHEARVLSQLHHPNLPVFQEAFHERGRYYVVLSYIEGNDLTDYIRVARQRNEVIPLARILTWMLSICDAVRFLHSQQPFVVHRDIKPDNIRITPNGTAILVDMGNAKATADGARTLFFARHQGTPGYAPPEQYPGGSGTDMRSDVYALGGTLYFALTTFEPPSVSARNQALQQSKPDLPSLQELLAKNPPEENPESNAGRQFRLGVSKPARPAPRHSRHLAQLGQLPPELLARLERIIRRAMAMKPKERYQTVAEFSNDLQGVMAALPAQPVPARATTENPYSTQPDLPLLYDAIQAARENKEKEQGPSPASTPSATAPARCPRCDAELARQAVFCPHCGYSLANRPRTNAVTKPEPGPANTTGNHTGQSQAQARDISTGQAAMIAPSHAPAHVSPTGMPAAANVPARAFPFPPAPPLPPPLPGNGPMQQQALQIPTPVLQSPPASKSKQQAPLRRRMRTTLFLIALFVALLLILILIIFLLVTKGGHALGLWNAITTLALFREHLFSLGFVPACTPALTRIRARCAGVSAPAGSTQ